MTAIERTAVEVSMYRSQVRHTAVEVSMYRSQVRHTAAQRQTAVEAKQPVPLLADLEPNAQDQSSVGRKV